MKILLDISFVGTAYCGYQVQPDVPTIQSVLNSAARQLFGYECDIVGCSRTDSGVHANSFFATVSEKGNPYLTTTVPISNIPVALSVFLPPDISVKSARWVNDDFHARYDVRSKEYIYLILNSRIRNPFLYDRAWHYPRYLDDSAVKRMNDAAQYFVGTHDFSSYMAANSSVTDTVRTVFDASVCRKNDIIEFRISADGFLYNMVRIFTGTLIAAAEGKILPRDIQKITDLRDRSAAGMTAPACGLYLNKVVY